jgi:hypothetical protein
MEEIERRNACLITGDSGGCLRCRFFDLLADGWIFAGFAQGARRVQANGLIRVFWLLHARLV